MFVSSSEACKILGIHPNTLRKFARLGKIDFIVVGKNYYIYNVDKFIEEQTKEAKQNAKDKQT